MTPQQACEMTVDQLLIMSYAQERARMQRMADDAIVLKASISACLSSDGFEEWKKLLDSLNP